MSVIRRYQPTDRGDVYRVCVMTGTSGGDATGLHANDDVIPDIFAGPYLAIEPELAFVVDTGERVAGYVIATGNTRRFARRYREAWLPAFAAKHPRTMPRPASGATPADRMIDLGYRPERMLIAEVDEYPAHLHIDLLPEIQGQGLGRSLIRTLLAALNERGIRNVHLGLSPTNTSARAFYDRLGFHELHSSTASQPLLGIATDAAV